MIEMAFKRLLLRQALLMASVLAVSCGALQAQSDGSGGPPPDGPPPGESQQTPEHGPSVERELKQLTHSLALTTEQQAQVKAILTDKHEQIEALFNQSKQSTQNGKTSADAASGDDQRPSAEAVEQSRAAVKAIREDASAKIAALLTDDQKTRFAALEDARQKAEAKQDELPPPTPDGGGGPPPDGGGGAPGGGPPGI